MLCIERDVARQRARSCGTATRAATAHMLACAHARSVPLLPRARSGQLLGADQPLLPNSAPPSSYRCCQTTGAGGPRCARSTQQRLCAVEQQFLAELAAWRGKCRRRSYYSFRLCTDSKICLRVSCCCRAGQYSVTQSSVMPRKCQQCSKSAINSTVQLSTGAPTFSVRPSCALVLGFGLAL